MERTISFTVGLEGPLKSGLQELERYSSYIAGVSPGSRGLWRSFQTAVVVIYTGRSDYEKCDGESDDFYDPLDNWKESFTVQYKPYQFLELDLSLEDEVLNFVQDLYSPTRQVPLFQNNIHWLESRITGPIKTHHLKMPVSAVYESPIRFYKPIDSIERALRSGFKGARVDHIIENIMRYLCGMFD